MKLSRKDKNNSGLNVAVIDEETRPNGNGSLPHGESAGSTIGRHTSRVHTGNGTENGNGNGKRTGIGNGTAPRAGTESAVGLIGGLLVQRGLVTEAQVLQARAVQEESGGRLGEVLVGMGALGQRDLVGALAEFFGMTATDLRRDNPESAALALVPEEVAREHLAMPIRLDDDGLHIAVSDKPSEELRLVLSETSGHQVRLTLAPLTDIRWAIDSSYRAIGGVDKLVEAFVAVEGTRKRTLDRPDTEELTDDAPVVQVVARILTQAMRDRASDVHIEPSQEIVRVRFRIDGALKEVLVLPAAMGLGLVSRIKIMAGMNIVERRRPQDGQLTTEVDGTGHRRPGLHRRHHLGREVRHADPRQEPLGPPARRPRHAGGHPRHVLRSSSGRPSAWCSAPARPAAARRRRSTPPSPRSATRRATS